jgi:CheY-like chemotaxis protein
MLQRTDASDIPIKCFLIDDDQDDHDIFAMAVKEFNESIHCYFAADAIEALERLNTDDFLPDCIFIDMNMPRMNGIECLERIKSTHRLRPVPVCMYSTSLDPNMLTRSKELGAKDFIVKPASVSVLSKLLGGFIKSNILLQ